MSWTCPDCGGTAVVLEDMLLYCGHCDIDLHEDDTPEAARMLKAARSRWKQATFFEHYGLSRAQLDALAFGRPNSGRSTHNQLQVDRLIGLTGTPATVTVDAAATARMLFFSKPPVKMTQDIVWALSDA